MGMEDENKYISPIYYNLEMKKGENSLQHPGNDNTQDQQIVSNMSMERSIEKSAEINSVMMGGIVLPSEYIPNIEYQTNGNISLVYESPIQAETSKVIASRNTNVSLGEEENDIVLLPLDNSLQYPAIDNTQDQQIVNNMSIERSIEQSVEINSVFTSGIVLPSEYIPNIEYQTNGNISLTCQSPTQGETSKVKASRKKNVSHGEVDKYGVKKMKMENLDTVELVDMDVKKSDLIHPFIASDSTSNPGKRYKINHDQRIEKLNNSIDMLRKLVPGIKQNMDRTTIIEMSVNYVKFLKNKIGSRYDLEFLRKIHI